MRRLQTELQPEKTGQVSRQGRGLRAPGRPPGPTQLEKAPGSVTQQPLLPLPGPPQGLGPSAQHPASDLPGMGSQWKAPIRCLAPGEGPVNVKPSVPPAV